MTLDAQPDARLARALVSLEGLSVGDAFGERFFVHPSSVGLLIGERALPAPPWRYTDDTQMALSIVETLARDGEIHQDHLASSFGKRYDISRGYGPAMHQLLPAIRSRKHWSKAAQSLFGGQGSFGNGAAMRAAPIGAYFADDVDAVVENARRAAEVTHSHPEGIAGGIAVAVAAAWAWRLKDTRAIVSAQAFFDHVLPHIPESNVYVRTVQARNLRPGVAVEHAAATLGNGSLISAQDTVAFTLWCAARHLNDYEEALWATVSGLGDRDTTCAIVGGIVACNTGVDGIPVEWRTSREPLPDWLPRR